MRRTLPATLFICLFLILPPPPKADHASAGPGPGSVVISEVYGGGGNSEAAYANDYVELFNRTKDDVDLTGWSVGYSSASSSTWSSAKLSGKIAAYRYVLVRFGGAGGGGAPVPSPDVTASTNIARSAGKIRLNSADRTIDLVGYGSDANASETKPAPAATNNATSIQRQPTACTDTNDNSKDYRSKTPTPKNRATTGYVCGSAPVLSPIGDKTTVADKTLSFTVSATDKENDPLTFSASSLPPRATFTPSSRTFSWKPSKDDVGIHHGVTFSVTDGTRKDSEAISITVREATAGGGSLITIELSTMTKRLNARGNVAPNHAGHDVVLKLYRWQAGGWRKLDAERAALDSGSAYSVNFVRPSPGKCVVNATFPGDSDHSASSVEKAVSC